MRRLVVTVVTLWMVISAGTAVWAGGAVWEFEGYHRPGDVVESTTAVAWGHNPTLGAPEDGPYLVYLAPNDLVPMEWPGVPEEAILVGAVEVHTGPYWPEGEELEMGPHHATARFEIPDVAAGSYQVLHCNDPCTTTLGDIIGGWDLRVLPGDDGRSAAAIAAEVKAMVPSLPLLFDTELKPALIQETSRTTTVSVTALIGSELVVV